MTTMARQGASFTSVKLRAMIEKLLRPVRLVVRGAGLVLALLWGVLIGLLLVSLRLISPRLRDRALRVAARSWFACIVRVMGVRQKVIGQSAAGPVLIVANHVSWLDIAVLGAQSGASFVSKSEVAAWPLVGWLAREGGTLFIHRGKHDSAERIAHDMTARLARNPVMFFPEGTTTDGTYVRRFKNRLFQPALHANVPVQPVAIRYERGNEPVDPVAYVQGISLLQSVLGVLQRRRTDVAVAWGEPVPVAGRERRDIAVDAERSVVEAHRNMTNLLKESRL